MSRPESAEERAVRIAAELRAATSEAAGVLKDLHAVIRSAREQIDAHAVESLSVMLDRYSAAGVAMLTEQNDKFLASWGRPRRRRAPRLRPICAMTGGWPSR